MKKVLLYVVLPIVIMAVALIVGVLTGHVYMGVKSPQQVVKTPYMVCDEHIITSYNNIRLAMSRATNEPDEKKQTEEMKKLAEEVAAKPHHDQDPTCAFITLSYPLYYTQDAEAAQKEYEKLEKATESAGVYVDQRIQGAANLESLKSLISAYSKIKQLQNQGSNN